MDYWDDAVKEVNVALWLADNHFPAAGTYDVAQPVEAAGRPVTFWQFIDGRPGDERDIGTLDAVLRRLPTTPPPTSFTLPPEDILERVESRIISAPVPSADNDFLPDTSHDLSEEVSTLDSPLSPAPTHGDAHSENLMIRNGEAVLADFERFTRGQAEWDLAMTATEYLTAKWWTHAQYAQFCDAYGYDVTNWTEYSIPRWQTQSTTRSVDDRRPRNFAAYVDVSARPTAV